MSHPVLVPLTATEKRLLEDELRGKNSSLFAQLFFAVCIAVVFPIIPSRRHHRPWPPSRERYLTEAIVLTLFLWTMFLWSFFTKTRNLKRDLQLTTRVVGHYEILRRERSYVSKTYTVWLATEESAFKSFKIQEEEYDRALVGQFAVLEYAEHSKFLFKLTFGTSF